MKAIVVVFTICYFWPFMCGAAVFTEDFNAGFGEWSWQWDDMRGGREGVAYITDTMGFNDSHSVRLNLDGRSDVGMLWIERRFSIAPGTPGPIEISFELCNQVYSDVNRWNVMAYVGENDPEVFEDFSRIGSTNTQAGWVNFNVNAPAVVSGTGDVWVAVGLWASWEAVRSYEIDHVQVTVSAVPIPGAMVLMGSGLLGLIGVSFRKNASTCPSEATAR